jgi:hypothetical protein
MCLEYYMCEKIFSWEVQMLKEVTTEYFHIRKLCEEQYPDCMTNMKLKVCLVSLLMLFLQNQHTQFLYCKYNAEYFCKKY